MKNIILLAILAVTGYKTYQHFFSVPYVGEWKIDKEKMLAKIDPEKLAIIPPPAVDALIGKYKLVIDNNQFHYTFPDHSGSFDYTAKKMKDGCFEFHLEKLKTTIGCVDGDHLKFVNDDSDQDDYFVRVK